MIFRCHRCHAATCSSMKLIFLQVENKTEPRDLKVNDDFLTLLFPYYFILYHLPTSHPKMNLKSILFDRDPLEFNSPSIFVSVFSRFLRSFYEVELNEIVSVQLFLF